MADSTADTSGMMLQDAFISLVILEAYSKFSLSFNHFLKFWFYDLFIISNILCENGSLGSVSFLPPVICHCPSHIEHGLNKQYDMAFPGPAKSIMPKIVMNKYLWSDKCSEDM